MFEGSHLPVDMVLRLIILYIDNITSYEQIRNQFVDEQDIELSNETVNDWLMYLREVQLEALVHSSQTKIGVQIVLLKLMIQNLEKEKTSGDVQLKGGWRYISK